MKATVVLRCWRCRSGGSLTLAGGREQDKHWASSGPALGERSAIGLTTIRHASGLCGDDGRGKATSTVGCMPTVTLSPHRQACATLLCPPRSAALCSNRHRARRTSSAPPLATSCLGASPTPADSCVVRTSRAGVRETCTSADDRRVRRQHSCQRQLRRYDSGKSGEAEHRSLVTRSGRWRSAHLLMRQRPVLRIADEGCRDVMGQLLLWALQQSMLLLKRVSCMVAA